ncbi:TAXI family TRAP transporter solute-binding subunit [Orrella daihaiensis]|uniref:C4-dicarboxylate ABC transporter substrate-binding protein n=1 Tax=Orrella daihaiensis TaxID=2782176 RepID=A0ABY4ALU4_9BURK|nr:TAXI family TRAP transporter solute-binding subunit [Orrella daihaiensis]UOD51285.1 hypothetical protein DHf2319_05195 [Orrella daihaiensis]
MSPPRKRLVSDNFKDHILGFFQDIQWSILAWYRYVKETWPIFVTLLSITAVAIYFAEPPPPSKVTFAAGVPGGSYEDIAKRYKDFFKRYDIELEVLPSTGPLANLQRMVDHTASPRIDVALTQSGLASDVAGVDQLAYLGSIDYEPIFFLMRKDRLPQTRDDFIDGLSDKRLGIGEPGTGTKVQFERLLALNDLTFKVSNFVVQSDQQSVADVLSGELDGVVLVDGIQSKNMQALLNSPEVVLLSPSRVQAYHRLLPYLDVLTIPEGSINLVDNVPAKDMKILSTTTALVVQKDLHPAIQFLLIKAAVEISGTASFFARQDTFPKFNESVIVRSPVAQEYFLKGSPYLDRHLPFWLAELLDRFAYVLMPFLAFAYPILLSLPGYRHKRLTRRIWNSYGKLKELELELSDDFDPLKAEQYLERLDQIESDAMRVKIYGSQGADYFKHRQHIHFVRAVLYEHLQKEGVVSGTEAAPSKPMGHEAGVNPNLRSDTRTETRNQG